jgi:hypothetical protein
VQKITSSKFYILEAVDSMHIKNNGSSNAEKIKC